MLNQVQLALLIIFTMFIIIGHTNFYIQVYIFPIIKMFPDINIYIQTYI